MQYSPKLKKAMQEIKAILQNYDIAGSIVLHTPNHSEFLLQISPSYSCAKLEGDNLRVRAKLNEDFNGDKEAWKQKVMDTSNMLNLLAEVGGKASMSLFQISDKVDETVSAQHFAGGNTSHTTQNN